MNQRLLLVAAGNYTKSKRRAVQNVERFRTSSTEGKTCSVRLRVNLKSATNKRKGKSDGFDQQTLLPNWLENQPSSSHWWQMECSFGRSSLLVRKRARQEAAATTVATGQWRARQPFFLCRLKLEGSVGVSSARLAAHGGRPERKTDPSLVWIEEGRWRLRRRSHEKKTRKRSSREERESSARNEKRNRAKRGLCAMVYVSASFCYYPVFGSVPGGVVRESSLLSPTLLSVLEGPQGIGRHKGSGYCCYVERETSSGPSNRVLRGAMLLQRRSGISQEALLQRKASKGILFTPKIFNRGSSPSHHTWAPFQCHMVEDEEIELRLLIGPLHLQVFGSKKGRSTTKFQWSKGWGFPRHEECAVCLDHFKAGELLVHLPCAHYFHSACVIPIINII
ncbi:hypothetical protein EJ110_NYTH13787 [Nymphaea thermarum]|nr:hypothetical protein EJ110_NYTH13787 [Nymphaea thermarum]